MTERLPRKLRADAEDNRERILAAARTLFARDGLTVPMRDIAREAGLSTAAVSQALRPQAKSNIKLQEETAERIRKIARDLNYQPHTGARSIRSNSFGTIGYFAAKTGLFNNSPAGYLAGVHDVAEEQGSRITLIRLPVGIDDISKAMPSVFSERNLDALVIESYSELASQIYEHLEEVADRLEDAANQINAIVIQSV